MEERFKKKGMDIVKMSSSYGLKDERSEDVRTKELFDSIRKNVIQGMSEEQVEQLKKLGEKFHESFDVTSGSVRDLNVIEMEEALAYVVESLKSGIHPSYLTEDEVAMVKAGYGEEWYKNWGYSKDDIEMEEKK